MNITELPPGPEPARLTAQHTARSLHDHLEAFLNTNNVKGFPPELPSEDSQLMALLLTESEKPGIDVKQFKVTAWQVKDLAEGSLKLGRAQQLLAAVYGYRTYDAMLTSAVRGYIKRKIRA